MSKAIEILKDIVGILERQKELGNIDKIIDIELEYHKKAIAEIEAKDKRIAELDGIEKKYFQLKHDYNSLTQMVIPQKDKRIAELEALSECNNKCVHYDEQEFIRIAYCDRCKRNNADNFQPKNT